MTSSAADIPDNETRTQFELIRDISQGFAEAGLDWWLFGGWAMDFHAGEVTRDHSDVELLVGVEDAERVRGLLLQRGFTAPAPLHPDEGQPYVRAGQEIGVWYLARNHLCGRWSEWGQPPGSFGSEVGEIDGVRVPVVSIACLLEMKVGFANQPAGGALREKDRRDIAFLQELLRDS